MELRLHDFRDRWRQGEHTVPLRIGSEIPFSAEGLHAMRVGGCGGAGRGGGGGAAARVTPATDAAAFGAAHHQDYSFAHESPQGRQWFRSFGSDASPRWWWSQQQQQQQQQHREERQRLFPGKRPRRGPYEFGADDHPCDYAFRCGQWFLLVLTICFVAAVVTLLSMVFVKIGQMMDAMEGTSVQQKFNGLLDHAMGAALHTEVATANAAEMSALAKTAMQEAHPRLIGALNQTSEMMADLRDFSLHPQLTVSAGAFGRRRRD